MTASCFTPFTLDLKNQLHRFLLYDAILSNDSTFQEGKGMGDPTEYCLLEMAENAGVDHSVIRELMPRKAEIPFDSDRKLMSTKYNMRGKLMILTKGAVDVLLSRTDRIAFSDGVRPITEEDRQTIMEQNNKFSENGLRVLAFGYKDNDETEPSDS